MSDASIQDPSLRDFLTGLPNRRALFAALRERVPSGSGALVLVDLDGFRKASRTLSKAQVDGLLRTVSDRLTVESGTRGRLFRYAMDAFALLIPETERDAAVAAADQLRDCVGRDGFIAAGGAGQASEIVSLTACAGVAAYPLDGRTPTSLVETAELAVAAAKHLGPGRTGVAGRLDPAALARIGVFRGLPCPVLVGRVAEQARLRQAAQDVRNVGPTVALISGPSGIGKSRLLSETSRWARSERFVVLVGACQEARATLPYSALTELVEHLLLTDRATATEALGRLDARHQAALAVVVRELPRAAEAPSIALDEYGRLIVEAFEGLLSELARSGPLVLALDEAEHADAPSIAVLRSLRERRLPFLVLLATNQEPAAFSTSAAGIFHREGAPPAPLVTLSPLTTEEVERLLHAVLPDADIAAAAARRLVEGSKGNPLWLEETLRALLLKGRVQLVAGRWSLPSVEERDLPKTLDDAVSAVTTALPPRAGGLLSRAAVLGLQIDPEILQEVMGQDEMEMLDLIDEARRSRLLVSSEQGGDQLLFPAAHARRVRLATTPAEERKEIHGRIGVVQEARHGGDVAHIADELAYHYGRAGNEERARHFDGIARRRAALLQPPQAEGSRRARLEPRKEPLPPAALGHATGVFRHFLGALKIGRLYPESSSVAASFLAQLREELDTLLDLAPGITLSLVPAGPQLNGTPCPPGPAADFAVLLDEQLVDSITILRSFDRAGLETLVRAFMQPLDRSRIEPDHWDRFLTREGFEGLDLVQKAFQARDAARDALESEAEKPVPPELVGEVRDAVRALKASVDAVKLYPPGHALVEETSSTLARLVPALAGKAPSITFGAADGELVLNGRPVDRKFFGDAGAFLVQEIERRELKSLAIRQGISEAEVRALIGLLATPADADAAIFQRLEGRLRHVVLGSRRYERATEGAAEVTLAPPPKPIRSELRARELLRQPYETFLSKEFTEQFAVLVEVLAYGTRRPLAGALVTRLVEHFHDAELQRRRIALRLLGNMLAFASPSARQIGVGASHPALRKRLLEDAALAAFKLVADLLHLWIPAAATSGCLKELADLAASVLRPRSRDSATPPDIAAACDRVLQVLPDTGAYALLVASAGKPRAEERIPAVQTLLAIGGRAIERLVDILLGDAERGVRWNVALAVGHAPEEAGVPLQRALTLETPPDRVARAVDVLQPLLTPGLLTHLGDLAERGRPEVRRAILDQLPAWPPQAAPPILRRLILGPLEPARDAALELAAKLRVDGVGAEVGRILEKAENERLVRLCCRYFAEVPNAGAVPLLSRVVQHRPRFFGMVKGYSEETRDEAQRALDVQKLRQGSARMDAAAHDPVTKQYRRL
jgi:diguanylate cyclase (GGDEF)-like protein